MVIGLSHLKSILRQGWEAGAHNQCDIYLEAAHCLKIERVGEDT